MEKIFRIFNLDSGHVLGFIKADTPENALDLLSREANYENYSDACRQTGSDSLRAVEASEQEINRILEVLS